MFSFIYNVTQLLTPLKILWVLLIAGGAIVAWLQAKRDSVKISYRPWWFFLGFFVFLFVVFIPLTGAIWDVQVTAGSTESLRSVLLQEFSKTDTTLLSPISQWVAFGEKALGGLLALLLLVFSSVGYGGLLKPLLPETRWRFPLQLGMGLIVLTAILFALGLMHVLSVPFVALGVLLFGIACGLLFSRGEYAFLIWQKHTIEYHGKFASLAWVLWTIVFLMLATTFVHLIRPIPIGWDDISLYMNLPKLTFEQGGLVSGFGAYNWGLIMSLGFLVFQTPFVAMLFSAFGGVLALWILYKVVRSFEKEETNTIIPLLFTTVLAVSPFFLFQFGEDMKVDLILLFFGGLAFLLIKEWWSEDKGASFRYPILIGMILGMLLGIKFTTLIFAFFVFFILLYRAGGRLLAMSGTCVFVILLLVGNVFSFSGIEISDAVRTILYVLAILGAGLSFAIAIMYRKIDWKRFQHVLVSALCAIAVFSPWMAYQAHSFVSKGETIPSFQGVLMGKPASPVMPKTVVQNANETLSSEDQALIKDVEEEGGAVKEELGRYQGFERGAFHFLSLPFDTTFSKNVSGDYVTIGWVYLGMFGFVIFVGYRHLVRSTKGKIGLGLLMLFSLYLLLRGAFGITILDTALMQILSFVSFGHATEATVTVQIVIMLLATVIFMWFWRIEEEHNTFVSVVFYATFLYGMWWAFLASGVVWYGILILLGVLGLAGYFFQYIQRESVKTILVYLILLLWVLPMSLYRLSMTTTSTLALIEDEKGLALLPKAVASIDQRQFMLYKTGILNADEAFQYMNQEYYAAQKVINANPGSKVYRIGTLLPYFIEKNNERILTDNQLDVFFEHYMPHKDKDAFTDSLKQGGFTYVVFDANTASIDQTKEKTLTRKVELFKQYAENNDRLRRVPLVEGAGSVYLYEIL